MMTLSSLLNGSTSITASPKTLLTSSNVPTSRRVLTSSLQRGTHLSRSKLPRLPTTRSLRARFGREPLHLRSLSFLRRRVAEFMSRRSYPCASLMSMRTAKISSMTYLDWAPRIANDADSGGYTRDISVIALQDDKFGKNFKGNFVYLGMFLLSYISFSFSFPLSSPSSPNKNENTNL